MRVFSATKQIAAIQEAINQKNFIKHKTKVDKHNNKAKALIKNPLIQKELDLNAQLSQSLLEQTGENK